MALPSVLSPPEHTETLAFQQKVLVMEEHLDVPPSLKDSPKPTNLSRERLIHFN